MNRAEILAPAGSFEALKAAVAGGCDAVYLGGSRFGARAYAKNFAGDELLEAIDYCHIKNKRLYLTVNTLVKQAELEESLFLYLKKPYEEGLDAVIVQDYGVMTRIHELFPRLPIHASTQMTLTSAEGANLLKNKGVTRVVPARELSLLEIKKMREGTELELECFVHGALCYSYSGQCLLSSMLGGRSGNRGRCAQPCRQIYSALGSKGYLLSPRDLCTLLMVPELLEAGIDSFKIEGRMKSPEYCGFTAFAYKTAVEHTLCGKKLPENLEADLLDLYNRGGSTKGYYIFHNSPEMMSTKRPNHYGRRVATVAEVTRRDVTISLSEEIRRGDVLEIRKDGRSLYEFTVGENSFEGRDRLLPGDRLRMNIYKGMKIDRQLPVFRTRNSSLIERIDRDIISSEPDIPVKVKFYATPGQALRLSLLANNISVEAEGQLPQIAENRSATKEEVKKQLKKLGGTGFCIADDNKDLTIDLADGLFIPVSSLNNLRRDAVEQLERAIMDSYKREEPAFPAEAVLAKEPLKIEDDEKTTITVKVSNEKQLEAVLCQAHVDIVYLPVEDFCVDALKRHAAALKNAGKRVYLYLPQICRIDVYEYLKENYFIELENLFDGYVVRSYEGLDLVKRYAGAYKRVILDYNMYVMNTFAAKAFAEEIEGVGFTMPVEMSMRELKAAGLPLSSAIVYGHQILMTSAGCLYKTTGRCTKQYSGIDEAALLNSALCRPIELCDEKDRCFYVKRMCSMCMNTIYYGECLDLSNELKCLGSIGIRDFRIDFNFEDEMEAVTVLRHFSELIRDGETDVSLPGEKSYTKGHIYRGVE